MTHSDLNQTRFDMQFSEVYPVRTTPKTYILVTPDGQEIPAVLVDEVTIFDATANDIRLGKTAVTDSGVTVGEKVIPSYNTMVGTRLIPNGSSFTLPEMDSRIGYYDYTKLQTMICKFNSSISKSVSTEKVSIDDTVYNVKSTEPISTITKNHETKSMDFGITNDLGVPCIIRYFTYKEIL